MAMILFLLAFFTGCHKKVLEWIYCLFALALALLGIHKMDFNKSRANCCLNGDHCLSPSVCDMTDVFLPVCMYYDNIPASKKSDTIRYLQPCV